MQTAVQHLSIASNIYITSSGLEIFAHRLPCFRRVIKLTVFCLFCCPKIILIQYFFRNAPYYLIKWKRCFFQNNPQYFSLASNTISVNRREYFPCHFLFYTYQHLQLSKNAASNIVWGSFSLFCNAFPFHK